MAIGSRSQSARTYLEKHLDVFPNCATEELVAHGLRALRDTLPNEVELTVKVNTTYWLVIVFFFIFHYFSLLRMYLLVLLGWIHHIKNLEKLKQLVTYR